MPAPVPSRPLPKADASELAKSMLLRLSDFPAGWRAGGTRDEGCSELSGRFDLLACEHSQDFGQGAITTVWSGVALLADEVRAGRALDFLEGAWVHDPALREGVAEGVREAGGVVGVGDVTVGQVSFPAMGDRSSAWEIVYPVTAGDGSATGYLDIVFVLQDNAVALLTFGDVFDPFDPAERDRLTAVVVDRMKDALPTYGEQQSREERPRAG